MPPATRRSASSPSATTRDGSGSAPTPAHPTAASGFATSWRPGRTPEGSSPSGCSQRAPPRSWPSKGARSWRPQAGLRRRPERCLYERLRRHGQVGVLDDAGNVVVIDSGVEVDADPATMTHVRRPEVMLRRRAHERLLHPLRRRAPQRHVTGPVVVVHVHHERLLVADEERRPTVARPLVRLGEPQAQLADPVDGDRLLHGHSIARVAAAGTIYLV